MPRAPFRSFLAVACLTGLAPGQGGWQLRPPVTPRPVARAYHALAFDAANARTVLFGGYGFGGAYFGDTWLWDGTIWTQAITGAAPAPRLGHAMAYDSLRARIVLFGGATGGGNGVDADDTWEWDGVAWLQAQPTVRPPARRGACMAFDPMRGVCVLFGGGTGFTGTPLLADTWEWDGTSWTQRTPANVPPARWGACLVADAARAEVVLTGGHAGAAGTPADTWIFDGTDWQQRFPPVAPPGRLSPGGAYDENDQVVVTFGGQSWSPGQTFHDTTWIWNGTEWREDPRSPRPGPQMAFALAYDSARDRIVKYGGWWTAPQQDLWEYDVGALSTWYAAGGGCAGAAGVAALAPVPGSHPIAGATFTLELAYGTGANLAAVVLGVSNQVWGVTPLPLDLTALGMSGCSLYVSADVIVGLGLATGTAHADWAIPAVAPAIGFRFFAQAIVLEPNVNPFGAVMSNAGRGTIGTW